jgi:ribosomal protein S18 acetylase RimI-like enzyme
MDNKLTNGDLQLLNNAEKFWEFIRQLRNHPDVKEGFIQQGEISRDEHWEYMNKHSSCFYVCLYKNKLAGYVGCIEDDIRVATHPDFQGHGVAHYMITELMKRHPAAIAKVKIQNAASVKLFESCGFKKIYYLLERPDVA